MMTTTVLKCRMLNLTDFYKLLIDFEIHTKYLHMHIKSNLFLKVKVLLKN